MAYQKITSTDSENLVDDVTRAKDKASILSDKRRVSTTKFRAFLYILAAHVSGMLLSLFSPSWFSSSAIRSGDEINQIVPPSMSCLFFIPLPKFSSICPLIGSPVKTNIVGFDFSTDDWVPGPNDPNVTDVIFDNWTKLLPSKPMNSSMVSHVPKC